MSDTLRDIKNRRSIRVYSDKPVKDTELDRVLEAGTWAATGHGAQSPKMVVLEDKTLIAEVEKLNAAVLGNPAAKPFYSAPVVVVVFADTACPTWVDDGNMVIANLLLAAHAVGLGSCYIYRAKESFESIEGKALMKKWGLPENYKAVGNVVLGYAAQSPEPAPRKTDYIIRVKS